MKPLTRTSCVPPGLLVIALVALTGCAAPAASNPGATTTAAGPTPPALRLPGDVVPTGYTLELALDPAKDELAGTMVIEVEAKQASALIWLHGKGLSVARASVEAGGRASDATVSAHGDFLALALREPLPPGPARLRLEYTARMPAGAQEGAFRQSEGGRTYIYTQFEPTAARLVFPCFDEPSYKVPWQLTLAVPDGLVALANTPEEAARVAAGTRTIRFRKTRPMPSYLVAFAVGPFELIDLGRAGRARTPMRIAVPHGRAAEARYARRVTGELLAALERYFDMPYPFEKLDSVAVLDFPGAMENAGLVTYGASIILAKPNAETPTFQQGFANTAAHEIAHHWFGNLVTTAWWDDIWLNEAFATFMADRIVDDWQKEWGIPVKRVKSAQQAFGTDGLISARKVHNPIRVHNDIMGAFDEISYTKGGALLDMFEGWIGRERFTQAIRGYIAARPWSNATSKDFIGALAAGSTPEIATAFESFIEQGGFPLVSLALDCPAGGQPALELAQRRFLPIGSKGGADQRWSIPMCVAYPRGAGEDHVQCFLLSDRKARVPLETDRCPASIDGNARRGYYRVAYAGDLEPKLLARATADPAARATRLYNAKAMVDAGLSPMRGLLPVIPGVAREAHPEVVGVAVSLAAGIEPFVSAELRPRYQRFLATHFAPPARKLGFAARAGESPQASTLRPQLLYLAAVDGRDPGLLAEAQKLAARFLAAPDAVDPALAEVALAAAARADATLFERLEAAFAKTNDHRVRAALLAGMVLSRGPGHREKTLARLLEGSLVIEEVASLAVAAMNDPEIRAGTFDFIEANYEKIAAPLSPMVRPQLVAFAGFFCDQEHRARLDTVLRAKVKDMPGGSKLVEETLERIDLCVARRAKFAPEVAAFLAQLPDRG